MRIDVLKDYWGNRVVSKLMKNKVKYMKKYIDCDGVILDTETGLFDEYDILKRGNPELKKRVYLQNLDWKYWIEQAAILNDAINILKNYDYRDTDILTKVHSLNEASAKIKFFREMKIKNSIIIVPNEVKKSQIVDSFGNILVDDSNNNLVDWKENFGIPYYFGSKESEFDKIESLDDILNPKKLELRLKRR